jgi:hypothetical protein
MIGIISVWNPKKGSIPKPDKRIADHGASTPNVSQENGFYSWKLLPELQPDLMATW